MRILQVIASLDPVTGGPAESVRTTSKVWQAQGHTVEIATLDDPASPWLKPLPVIVHALGPGLLKYRYAPKFPKWLQANATRFDIVVLHGIYQYQAFATRQVLRRLGRPYVLFIHGALDPWFKRRYPLKHLKKWLYWPWGDYRVVRDAARVLFTTQDERSLARQSFWLYKAKEAVVPYGTSPAPVEIDDSQTRAFFEAFPALQSQPFLLFLSRIDEKKGCQLLIKSFAQIANQDPNLFLVMAGPDTSRLRVKLERLAMDLGIAHRMIWTGMISGSVKWGAYRAADAFVLTSHSENFGIVVAEALACGTPVLISKRVNIWREIAATGAGLVADDTLEASVRMLKEWLALDTYSRDVMAAKARQLFDERFEINTVSSNIAMELEKVLAEASLPSRPFS
jgi:glycosyltransferase involved in cell wall biosynthesis